MPLLAVGEQAPNFLVKDNFGNDVQLTDFHGKTVVLWFYPKADTPGCTREGCGFRDKMPEFSHKQAQILGVSFDTVEENSAFAEKFSFNFPLLCDTQRQIGLAYGACDSKDAANAKRISYVINPEGKISHVYEKVDTTVHADQVLDVI
ncbi:MAG: peroxiredoxin [Blastocatellia bacterium]|nr:peroxiredoxin [Blastocatellia bacterium]